MRLVSLDSLTGAPLPCLVSAPPGPPDPARPRPLLCFLHGYDEGAPTSMREGLTRHGPLAASAAPWATEAFIVVAAQLPVRGDLWLRYADAVRAIAALAHSRYGADPARLYLTGFSYGGNGVFDLALAQPGLWAALWPVDPTRVPASDPGGPIWLSSGEVSRHDAAAFTGRLGLAAPGDYLPGERVYLDRGADHVGTARLAYADERIYRWLLAQRLAAPGTRTRR